MKRSSALPWLRSKSQPEQVSRVDGCARGPMVNHRDANRRAGGRAAVPTLIAAVQLVCLGGLLDGFLGAPAAHAQSIMRTPSLNIAPRVPTITPSAAARVSPNIAGSVGRNGSNIGVRVTTVVHTAPRIAVVRPRLPYLHFS